MKFRGLIVALMWLATIGCILGGIYIHNHGGFGNNMVADSAKAKGELTAEHFKDHDLTSLQIDASKADIEIKEGKELKVEYAFRAEPEISYKDGNLIIRSKGNGGFFGFFFGGGSRNYLNITVPKGTTLDASTIELSAGNIDISELTAEALKIDCSAGDVSIASSEFSEKLDLDCSAGNLDVKDTTGDKVIADISAGNIVFEKSLFKDYNLDCSTGDIKLLGCDYSKYSMDLETSLGQVNVGGKDQGREYNASGTAGTIHADCSMGNVKVE